MHAWRKKKGIPEVKEMLSLRFFLVETLHYYHNTSEIFSPRIANWYIILMNWATVEANLATIFDRDTKSNSKKHYIQWQYKYNTLEPS
jgi:hypothetical protein